MDNSRREFIRNTTIAVAGAALLSNKLFAASDPKLVRVGLQLYSVRDAMSKDPHG